jgi:formate-dependent nitrite reductase membrane component NrfD
MSVEPGSDGPDGSGYRSYYGKPIIKEPVWEPAIPAYFFFGGTAGAAASLGLAARLSGNPTLARTATYVNAVAIGVSPALLIVDLGRPERFLNMLRMFKVTSPMSVGTWIVTVSGLASGLATSLETLRRLPRAKLAAEGAAGALGPFLSTYTAALLADTAVPAWHEARLELPFVFAGSSAASAGAACALIAPPRVARPARRLAIAGAALELTAASVMERRLGLLAQPYKRGQAGALATPAKWLTAAGAVTMVLQGRQRGGAIGAGALLLAGSVAERFAIFRAGLDSARDPRYTVVPQRQRVDQRAAEPEQRFR